jgi:hypothetical protein
LRLVKIAARVVEMTTAIKTHLPTSCPDQQFFPIALARIPRLATALSQFLLVNAMSV